MKLKYYFILAAVFVLSACGSAPQTAEISSTATTKEVPKKLSDLKYINYNFNGPISITINSESQSYKFESGESNLAAFKIKNSSKFLEIATQASGIFVPTMTVYMPSVLFLDSNFSLLQISEPTYYYKTGKMKDTRISIYYSAVNIPAKTEFIIMYTDNTKLTNKAPYLHGGAGVARLLESLEEEYAKIETSAFANGKVKSFVELGYRPSTYLTKSSVGALRMHISD